MAVSGTTLALGSNNSKLANANVAVVGATPTNATMSGSDGSFTLMIAAGSNVYLAVNASSYITSEFPVIVTPGGVSGLQLGALPTAFYNGLAQALNPMLTTDPSKGTVVVNFHGASVSAGGFGATLSAAHGMSFSIDKMGANPMYSMTTASGGNVLIFPNVDAGTTSVVVSAPSPHACTARAPAPAFSNFRVDANTLLILDYDCT